MLAVAYESWFNTEMAADFAGVRRRRSTTSCWTASISGGWTCSWASVSSPRPRDPKTGYPRPQWKPGDAVKATTEELVIPLEPAPTAPAPPPR